MKHLRLVALDLDDTTLDENGCLTPRTKTALESAIAADIEVIVASGRAFDSIPKEVLSIPGIRYVVSGNGGVCNLADGTRLRSTTLSKEATAAVLEIFLRYAPAPTTAFWQGVPYADAAYVTDPSKFGATGYLIEYIKHSRRPVQDVFAFALEKSGELDSLNLNCLDSAQRLTVLEELEHIPNIKTVSSTDRLIEVVDCSTGKEAGLAYFCELLQIDPKDAAAVGNAGNDAGMLRYAGLGVAVENASEECKASADLIIDSNANDGVARWLESVINEKTSVQT